MSFPVIYMTTQEYIKKKTRVPFNILGAVYFILLIVLLNKDALNWPKVIVKKFVIKKPISNKWFILWTFYPKNPEKKRTVSTKY